jgi:hypothetical protein
MPRETTLLENQFKAIVEANDRIIALTKKGLAGDYAKLLRQLKQIVADTHEQYASEGSLSYTEMQRYNRIKTLQAKLDKAVQTGTKPIFKKIKRGLEDVTDNTYSSSIAIIGGAAGIDLGGPLSADEIQAILDKPWSGVTLEERFRLRQTDIGNRVKQNVIRGIMKGDAYEDTAKGLKEVILKDYAWNGNLSGDIGHSYQSDTMQESFDTAEKAGITITKTWVTAGDDRVREDHDALDGQTVGADEKFTIPDGPNAGMQADGPGLFGIPEEDYNCRCWIVAGIKE